MNQFRGFQEKIRGFSAKTWKYIFLLLGLVSGITMVSKSRKLKQIEDKKGVEPIANSLFWIGLLILIVAGLMTVPSMLGIGKPAAAVPVY